MSFKIHITQEGEKIIHEKSDKKWRRGEGCSQKRVSVTQKCSVPIFFSNNTPKKLSAFKIAILPPPNNPSLTILSTCFVSYTDVVMYTNFVVIFLSLFSECHRRGGFCWERWQTKCYMGSASKKAILQVTCFLNCKNVFPWKHIYLTRHIILFQNRLINTGFSLGTPNWNFKLNLMSIFHNWRPL